MAIADGMAIDCSDLQAVGGTRFIAVRKWGASDIVQFNDTLHTITLIDEAASTGATWGVFESRLESSSLAITGANEGKEFSTYECTLSWFIPGITTTQFASLYDFDGECLMAMVIDNNDAESGDPNPSLTFANNKVIGVSNTLASQDASNAGSFHYTAERTQQWCRLQSIEGGTGTAFSDEIGVTVTLVAKQYEIPRAYIGTTTIDADGLGLTTGS